MYLDSVAFRTIVPNLCPFILDETAFNLADNLCCEHLVLQMTVINPADYINLNDLFA